MSAVERISLETERLTLRLWRTGDADRLEEILRHPDVSRMLGGLGAQEHAAVKVARYVEHWRERGYGRWALEDRASGELIGRVGVMHEERWKGGPDKDEIGWTLDRSFWGRGLATEAARAALADAFERVGLPRVVAFTLPENVASRRVMEKCGFSYRGRALWEGREHIWYARDRTTNNAAHDSFGMAL